MAVAARASSPAGAVFHNSSAAAVELPPHVLAPTMAQIAVAEDWLRSHGEPRTGAAALRKLRNRRGSYSVNDVNYAYDRCVAWGQHNGGPSNWVFGPAMKGCQFARDHYQSNAGSFYPGGPDGSGTEQFSSDEKGACAVTEHHAGTREKAKTCCECSGTCHTCPCHYCISQGIRRFECELKKNCGGWVPGYAPTHSPTTSPTIGPSSAPTPLSAAPTVAPSAAPTVDLGELKQSIARINTRIDAFVGAVADPSKIPIPAKHPTSPPEEKEGASVKNNDGQLVLHAPAGVKMGKVEDVEYTLASAVARITRLEQLIATMLADTKG